jgi:hypothetical protein
MEVSLYYESVFSVGVFVFFLISVDKLLVICKICISHRYDYPALEMEVGDSFESC